MRDPNALQRAKAFIAAQHGRIAPLPVSEEELNPDVQDDLSVQAYPLEDATRAYRPKIRGRMSCNRTAKVRSVRAGRLGLTGSPRRRRTAAICAKATRA